ncbi:hypothetical protein IT072_04225 [Leifsonia sp. ZF2019]|uniref:hypothetical protein n=1 Tax=Leifsonia sp. ZF2019 TaxID=2781978 RepID=UPI001CBAD2FD|nr:hypothetical protein [Leifsonia sp. ZF2019]UAJ80263.1 hypothetical protein IT072_04225 [Leifsonia sp. ZF2019]
MTPVPAPTPAQPALSLAEVESVAVPVMLAEQTEAMEFDRLAAKVAAEAVGAGALQESLERPARSEHLEVA